MTNWVGCAIFLNTYVHMYMCIMNVKRELFKICNDNLISPRKKPNMDTEVRYGIAYAPLGSKRRTISGYAMLVHPLLLLQKAMHLSGSEQATSSVV